MIATTMSNKCIDVHDVDVYTFRTHPGPLVNGQAKRPADDEVSNHHFLDERSMDIDL